MGKEKKDTEGTAATEEAAKPKKAPAKRRSIWVCVPTSFEEVAVADPISGEMIAVKQPSGYSITECPGGDGQRKAVLAALARHEIDPLNFSDVLLFRANPIDFNIGTQLVVRF